MGRLVVAALLALGGCGHRSAGGSSTGVDMASAGAFAAHDKVDILFVLGNEVSTSQDRNELRTRFPEFVRVLQAAGGAHPASYHIGIITPDLGAGPYVLNQGQCHPGGDGGRLQVSPNPNSVGVPAECSSFSLGGGERFIDYDQINGTTNIVGVPDVPTAFSCMSAVGSGGCGPQHNLEATYWALHENVPENAGFLRSDALLVVFYVADEDDCSMTTDSDLYDPSPDGVAKYGVLHHFRCVQFGITCGATPMPLPSMSFVASDCRPLAPSEGGKLIDVQKYIDFFSRPGGVKADPSDVILVSIAPPPTPVGVMVTTPCSDQVNTPQCPIENHSCVNQADPLFFGDPAVRLATVIQSAVTSQSSSLCDGNFSPAIADLAQKIVARLK